MKRRPSCLGPGPDVRLCPLCALPARAAQCSATPRTVAAAAAVAATELARRRPPPASKLQRLFIHSSSLLPPRQPASPPSAPLRAAVALAAADARRPILAVCLPWQPRHRTTCGSPVRCLPKRPPGEPASTDLPPVIAADGLYKRDVFSEHPPSSAPPSNTLTQGPRISGPVRRCYRQWRADEDHERDQEDVESILEREL